MLSCDMSMRYLTTKLFSNLGLTNPIEPLSELCFLKIWKSVILRHSTLQSSQIRSVPNLFTPTPHPGKGGLNSSFSDCWEENQLKFNQGRKRERESSSGGGGQDRILGGLRSFLYRGRGVNQSCFKDRTNSHRTFDRHHKCLYCKSDHKNGDIIKLFRPI